MNHKYVFVNHDHENLTKNESEKKTCTQAKNIYICQNIIAIYSDTVLGGRII